MRGTVVLDNVKDVTVARDAGGDTVTVDVRDGHGVVVLEMTAEVAEVLRRALLEPMDLAPGVELYAHHVITAVGMVAGPHDCFTCDGGFTDTETVVSVAPEGSPDAGLYFHMSCAAQEWTHFKGTRA